jgi:hypothetical protein
VLFRSTLSVVGNANTDGDQEISRSFASDGFYSVEPGIYVNDGPSQTAGITGVSLLSGGQATVAPHVYRNAQGGAPETPVFAVESDNPAVATVEQSAEDLGSWIITAVGSAGESCTVTVSDSANSFTTDLAVDVVSDLGSEVGVIR